MTSNPYELVGQLPKRVPYARRYKVNHRVLGKVVEFRVLPRSATEKQRAEYQAELEELLALDHPCFLPVLERGLVRERQAYVVPLREHKTIPERISEQSFYPPQAFAAVTSLAGGLAALHEQAMTVGPIDARMLSWDDRAATAYFLQRRRRVPKFLSSGERPFPEDVLQFQYGTPRSDVFHWGFFAYFLLSRGKYPYEKAGELIRLEERASGVPQHLQVAVEASLAWHPGDRPRDGLSLQKVLLIGGVVPARPKEKKEEPATIDQSASRAFDAILTKADDLHMSLGPAASRSAFVRTQASEAPEPEPEPEPVEEEAAEDVEDPESQDLSIETYQSGSGLAAVVVPADASTEFAGDIEAVRAAVDVEAIQGGGSSRASGASVALVGVATLLLGLALGWGVRGLFPSSRPPEAAPPGPTAPAPSADRGPESVPGAVPRPNVEPLAPDEARRYREDAQVMSLLKIRTVSRERVPETWKNIRSLMLQGRLPSALSDTRRLTAIRRAFEADPARGPGELGAFLEDLRRVLGSP